MRLLCGGASNALMGPFHVAFCGGGAWVEVACDPFGQEIGASIKETASDCFNDCRDRGTAHRLMCELDAVGLGLDGVCEETEFVRWGVWQRVFCCMLPSCRLGY